MFDVLALLQKAAVQVTLHEVIEQCATRGMSSIRVARALREWTRAHVVHICEGHVRFACDL